MAPIDSDRTPPLTMGKHNTSHRAAVLVYFLLLALAVAGLSDARAPWRPPPLLAAAWILAAVAIAASSRPVLAAMLLLFGILFLGGLERDPGARHGQCENNLRQIAMAISNYELVYGRYPPPFTTDEHGRPLHSWRVLLLPFCEEGDRYDQMDLSQPWDSPHNRQFAGKMPWIYKCPRDDSHLSASVTPYTAVVGANTVWSPNAKPTMQQVATRLSKTLLVMESSENRVHWMDPRSVTFDELVPVNELGGTLVLQSHHSGSRHASPCVFCDGHVEWLPDTLDWRALRAYWSISGE